MRSSFALAALFASSLAGTALAAGVEDTYELKTTDAKGTVGQKATATVTIAAKTGWKVNEEAPISIKLVPDPGVTVDKPKLGKADAAERTKEKARFDVALTAAEPGRKTVNAEASFVMCQATTCIPVRKKIALAVDATAPAAAPKKK